MFTGRTLRRNSLSKRLLSLFLTPHAGWSIALTENKIAGAWIGKFPSRLLGSTNNPQLATQLPQVARNHRLFSYGTLVRKPDRMDTTLGSRTEIQGGNHLRRWLHWQARKAFLRQTYPSTRGRMRL